MLAFDADLLAQRDAISARVDAWIHRGLSSARADGFELFEAVGQREKVCCAGKRLA